MTFRSTLSRSILSRSILSRLTLARAAAKPVLPVALGVALTATVAGGVAWTATGKTVTLSVDGQPREVDFRGDTVADALRTAGLDAGPHDVLVPAATTELEDGDEVALRRGRELQLVVDGVQKSVWVTAASVDEALRQVGLTDRGLALSASRSRSIPLDGLSLAVTTPKDITIVADGKRLPRTSAEPSVRDALIEADVHLDRDDRLSHDRALALTDGLVITVVRVRTERTVEDVVLPFTTERREDAALVEGTTKVLRPGAAGVARRTVERVLADGVLEKRTVVGTTQTSAPVAKVVAVGTKPKPEPKPEPAPEPASARSSAPATSSAARSSTGAGGLDWGALARCESGGNPRAVSSTGRYRGLYQFSLATWQSVGGSGDPIDHSAGEQTSRAQVLYARSGRGQWPHCGRYL